MSVLGSDAVGSTRCIAPLFLQDKLIKGYGNANQIQLRPGSLKKERINVMSAINSTTFKNRQQIETTKERKTKQGQERIRAGSGPEKKRRPGK